MENYVFDEEGEGTEDQILEGSLDSSEEGFLQGYAEDEEVEECAECGAAVSPEKKVVKEIEEETYVFCSKKCAQEFEESIAGK